MSDKDEDVFRPMTDEELCKACGIKLPELREMNEAPAKRKVWQWFIQKAEWH